MKSETIKKRLMNAIDDLIDTCKEEGEKGSIKELYKSFNVLIKDVTFVNKETGEEIRVVPCCDCLFVINPNAKYIGADLDGYNIGGIMKPARKTKGKEKDYLYITYSKERGRE